jgi:membrane protein required for colicin V production
MGDGRDHSRYTRRALVLCKSIDHRFSSMPVSIFDLVVLGVIFISALLAAVRGFTREVLAIASWGVAAVAALVLHPQLLPIVKEHISNATIALVVAIAVIFLVTLVIVSFITVRLSDIVLDSRIGALDRTLGFMFGAARGVLICIIGYQFFIWLVPDKMQPEWAKTARTRPLLDSTGQTLLGMMPENLDTAISSKLKKPKLEGEIDAPADAPPAGPQPQNRSHIGAPGVNFAIRFEPAASQMTMKS